VGEAALGSRLLTTNNPQEAKEIAEHLDRLNLERRAIEVDLEEEATRIVEAEGVDQPFLMPIGYGWHQGVVGIIASRLKERYNRPCAVVTVHNGIAKGSSRSITGVDLGAAIASARDMGLALTGGGHAMAAGFTAEEAKLPELKKFITERLRAQVANAGDSVLKLDAVLNVNGINTQLAQEMEQAAPFGTGNSEPRLVIADCRLLSAEELRGGHVRCILDDGIGGKSRVYAMAFRSMEKELGQFLVKHVGYRMHLAVRIRHAFWQGREKVDVQIDDASLA
jgi:single-stranded-DNA-specific exonuclease